MERIIKSMENKYLLPSLGFVEDVFTKYKNSEEGKAVRQLVEEIRSKKYYLPELELLWLMNRMKSLDMQCFHDSILKENMKMNC